MNVLSITNKSLFNSFKENKFKLYLIKIANISNNLKL